MFFYQTPLSEEQIAIWDWLNQLTTQDRITSHITSEKTITALSTSLEIIKLYCIQYDWDQLNNIMFNAGLKDNQMCKDVFINQYIVNTPPTYTEEQLTLLTELFSYGLSKAQDALQAPEKAYHWYKCLAAFTVIAEISKNNKRFPINSDAKDILTDVLCVFILAKMQNNRFFSTWQNDHFFCHARFPFLNNKVSSKLEKLLQRVAELFSVAA